MQTDSDQHNTIALMHDLILVLMAYGIKELDIKALATLIGTDAKVLDTIDSEIVTIDPEIIEQANQQKYLH